ncbi:hypothetical protein HPA88_08005 [Streptococcus suis]|uniref:Uncharacterized protein n=1 Tax=Streptococcus suis TaxID=1307 RepID=A0A116QL30_STRSU|nr:MULTISPECIES: hypothetical protein [Streptococcus]HEM3193844.1 hypothetical protein [Streptococcus suis 10581]MBY0752390.1 hypothetical protein [Streptococcus sp. 2018037]MBY4635078.1 hypothetical protein [Streptococcus suis]MCK4019002.1 hypothetical protein [Streptococcus suis]MCK4024313.1 hypothetical protein [Streptococcus suis]
MTQKELLARKCVVTDIMNSQRVSLPKAIAIMQEWEISGLIFFTPSGQTALLKTR